MTGAEIAEFLGMLVAAWVVGFTGGYIFTVFKRAFDIL